MKTIALLAVLAMLLVDVFGSKSSVGGPMTDLMVMFVVMLAVGIFEAWSKDRGPLSWVVNIVAAVLGGCVAVSLVGMAMETLLTQIHFEGRLATSDHPMRYVSEASMAVFTVLGSWITLQLIYWLPDRRSRSPGLTR